MALVVRAALGHGTILAGTAPDCTTPASNPARPSRRSALESAAPRSAAARSSRTAPAAHCRITVVAQAPPGWRFDRWAGACASRGTQPCTLLTEDLACSGGAEPECDDPVEFCPHRRRGLRQHPRTHHDVHGRARRRTAPCSAPRPRRPSGSPPTRTGGADLPVPARRGCVRGLHHPAHGGEPRRRRPRAVREGQGRVRARRAGRVPALAPGAAADGDGEQRRRPRARRPPVPSSPTAPTSPRRRSSAGWTRARSRPASRRARCSKGWPTARTRSRSAPPSSAQVSPVASHKWTVDVTPPETTITAGPNGATVDVAPTFEFAANEHGARFACSVDGGAPSPCASPFTTPPLLAGPHTVTVAATDDVGNTDPTPATATFTLKTGLATLVDADHDGFPEALDCNDRAANIHPGAPEDAGQQGRRELRRRARPVPARGRAAQRGRQGDRDEDDVPQLRGQRRHARGEGAGALLRRSRARSRRARCACARAARPRSASACARARRSRCGSRRPRTIGKVMRLPIVRNRFGTLKTLCLEPGARKPGRC